MNGNLLVAEAVDRDMPYVTLEDARLVYLYAEKQSPTTSWLEGRADISPSE